MQIKRLITLTEASVNVYDAFPREHTKRLPLSPSPPAAVAPGWPRYLSRHDLTVHSSHE